MGLQLDLTTEFDKKEYYLGLVDEKYSDLLSRARAWARHYCKANHGMIKYFDYTGGLDNTVTSDDVRELMGIEPQNPGDNNWMGSIFRNRDFKFTGFWYSSKADGSHARPVRIWRYVGSDNMPNKNIKRTGSDKK